MTDSLLHGADLDGSSTLNAYLRGIHLRVALRDGTSVCIRAVRPDDKERLRLAFERLSPGTLYRRFFHPKKAISSEELRTVTELDFRDHVSLAVAVEEETGERFIAVGRFVRVAPAAERAELALTVADEYQHRGAGTLLLQQLVAVARRSGLRQLVALVRDENRAMLKLLENLNLPAQRTMEDGVHRVVLRVAGSTREILQRRPLDRTAWQPCLAA